MPSLRLTALAACLTFALAPAFASGAEDTDKPKWDVNAAHGPTKTVQFTTDEGTWMDLDVSPDGRSIVFYLLGDLYLLPIDGGSAKRLTTGPAWDVQPRFSPDGKEIAFTSDRGGGNNLWRMPVDGSAATQVSKEDFRLLNNPAWTPDGQYLIGRKHFTGERSLGAGELWMYHRGGGAGLQLTKQKNDQQDLGEPAVARMAATSTTPRTSPPVRTFQYNKNPHDVIYAIKRLDRQTGEIETIVDSARRRSAPAALAGRQVARVRQARARQVACCTCSTSTPARCARCGTASRTTMQEAWAIFGPYAELRLDARFEAARDLGAGQALARRHRERQADADPVQRRGRADRRRSRCASTQTLDQGTFAPKMIRDVATSPDGQTLVFHAVGHLWSKALPSGAPERLTGDTAQFEYQPSFSAGWQKAALHDLVRRRAWARSSSVDLASGQTRPLTSKPGFYYGPRYSRDGSRIVYAKTAGGGAHRQPRTPAKPASTSCRPTAARPARIARSAAAIRSSRPTAAACST